MKTIFALALTAAIATPAFADPVATTPATAAPVALENSDAQRVCLVVPSRTGSFINRKICRTRADWAKDGVDPTTIRK